MVPSFKGQIGVGSPLPNSVLAASNLFWISVFEFRICGPLAPSRLCVRPSPHRCAKNSLRESHQSLNPGHENLMFLGNPAKTLRLIFQSLRLKKCAFALASDSPLACPPLCPQRPPCFKCRPAPPSFGCCRVPCSPRPSIRLPSNSGHDSRHETGQLLAPCLTSVSFQTRKPYVLRHFEAPIATLAFRA